MNAEQTNHWFPSNGGGWVFLMRVYRKRESRERANEDLQCQCFKKDRKKSTRNDTEKGWSKWWIKNQGYASCPRSQKQRVKKEEGNECSITS